MSGIDEHNRLIRLDEKSIPYGGDEIRAFLVVRNEILRLPNIFDHYRAMGVERFFIIDNGSLDGSVEYALSQPDSHVFSADESYAASQHGVKWLNTTLEAFGCGHWVLAVDADELFIYPNYERVKLPDFCRFLDHVGAQSVFALLLDMYSDKPISETHHEPGRSLIDTCRYFDAGPYIAKKAASFPYLHIYGGVRARLLIQGNMVNIPAPTISKVPLVKWHSGLRYTLSTHAMTPVPISNLGSILLHFKFLDDFHDRARLESARKEHFAEAREYRSYNQIMSLEPRRCLKTEQSVRFENSAQMLRLQLMKSSPDYDEFVRNLA